jgi:hypothetical protein
MADEPKADPMNDVYVFLGFMAILVAVWYFAGAPGKDDLKGLFISPPAPLGNGQAYGPALGGTSSTSADTTTAAPPDNSGFYYNNN